MSASRTLPQGRGMGQTGYSQPIPKAGIGGSPRFAARTPIGITSDKGSAFLPGAAAEPTRIRRSAENSSSLISLAMWE
jgi:hypothetical protein